jgi:hypothetical protein
MPTISPPDLWKNKRTSAEESAVLKYLNPKMRIRSYLWALLVAF